MEQGKIDYRRVLFLDRDQIDGMGLKLRPTALDQWEILQGIKYAIDECSTLLKAIYYMLDVRHDELDFKDDNLTPKEKLEKECLDDFVCDICRLFEGNYDHITGQYWSRRTESIFKGITPVDFSIDLIDRKKEQQLVLQIALKDLHPFENFFIEGDTIFEVYEK